MYIDKGVLGGETTIIWSPPSGGSQEIPPKLKIYVNYLVKCCNFIVNLGHSLGGDMMVEIMFNLWFFP